jgi:predicted membrane channel-forming protein YqfA (hemolysin III family)
MTLWQIVLAVTLIALWAWAVVAVLIDMFDRADLSGWIRIAWIAAIVLLPVLGVIVYFVARPRSTEAERNASASYEAAVVPDGEYVAKQLADLARLHTEGVITDDEFEERKKGLT